MDDAKKIIYELGQAGYRAAFLPFDAIEKISAVYEGMNDANETPAFAKNAAAHFKGSQPPDISFEPLSFLVAVCRSDPGLLVVNAGGKRTAIPVPPLYIDQDGCHGRLSEALEKIMGEYKTAHTKGISQKLLAVMGGLGRYGKNNIFYAEALGSGAALAAYYTNVPCRGETHPVKFLDECEACGDCKKKCPVGAISNYPVINAGLCLNKYVYNLDPIPEDIPLSVFNALIGCWACQTKCPANFFARKPEENVLELDDAESSALLAWREPLPAELKLKLSDFFKNDHLLSVAGRNAALVCGVYER
ncbi:MAG: 4Fe-4S binding protein [Defluviitaleaceae bacterium]|nr:4Fe-4S binding protein [Defluviitaleaceae bacterium]